MNELENVVEALSLGAMEEDETWWEDVLERDKLQ